MTTPFTAASPIFNDRRAGILLHPTSLPGANGCGDIGAVARQFLQFLAGSGCSVWQMLPTGPTHGDRSPYQSLSVHAGSCGLISLDDLVQRGWLAADALAQERDLALRSAAEGFQRALHGDAELARDYAEFCRRHATWLDDYALFTALREARGGAPWYEWPQLLRTRDADALAAARAAHATRIAGVCFEQFAFALQWHELRSEARQLGVFLFGDMPIFVAHDSADVWAQQSLFRLDDDGQPRAVAGVPPDYFSTTGQRWGNPHYHWQNMQARGFDWWLGRVQTQLEYFDLIRVDHFRGFEACWEIPGDAETAIDGHWVKAPGAELLGALFKAHPELPLVAENLGMITSEVEALRNQFHLPGMLILQFAFDGSPGNPYVPHRHDPLEVVYTGTHDNDTTLGWYQGLDDTTRARVDEYLGWPREPMPWPLIRAALASVARLAIIPMQDLLALDGAHRMNVPGTSEGNWCWQFQWQQIPQELQQRLRHLLGLYGRIQSP